MGARFGEAVGGFEAPGEAEGEEAGGRDEENQGGVAKEAFETGFGAGTHGISVGCWVGGVKGSERI